MATVVGSFHELFYLFVMCIMQILDVLLTFLISSLLFSNSGICSAHLFPDVFLK